MGSGGSGELLGLLSELGLVGERGLLEENTSGDFPALALDVVKQAGGARGAQTQNSASGEGERKGTRTDSPKPLVR